MSKQRRQSSGWPTTRARGFATRSSVRALAGKSWLALPALLLAGAPASADPGLPAAAQRGVLKAGVSHVVPTHVGGDRFRSPESLETGLAEELAQRLALPLQTVQADPARGGSLLQKGQLDLLWAMLPTGGAASQALSQAVLLPTGYTAAPMAIMRTDTHIKRWQQLKGQRVCLSRGGAYVGQMAARYGAVEVVQPAPADSLLALRVGECDAAVHDDTLLEALLRMPEWKKFSARLQPELPRTELTLAVPAKNEKAVRLARQAMRDWESQGLVQRKLETLARNIAFEVYLSQDVPDCH